MMCEEEILCSQIRFGNLFVFRGVVRGGDLNQVLEMRHDCGVWVNKFQNFTCSCSLDFFRQR